MPTLSAFEQAVEAGCEGLRFVSPGVCPTCPNCQELYGMKPREFFTAYENGKLCDDPHFSWRSCECCGSGLGGDRYEAHGMDSEGTIVHFTVCEDCLCYLANGDHPKHWEG